MKKARTRRAWESVVDDRCRHGRDASARRVLALGPPVDGLAQRLAGLEVRHQLLRDRHLLAAAGIAPHARRTAVDREAAETADLDAVPARERIGHCIEDRLHRELGVALRQLAEAVGEPGNE